MPVGNETFKAVGETPNGGLVLLDLSTQERVEIGQDDLDATLRDVKFSVMVIMGFNLHRQDGKYKMALLRPES